jgi:VCBS repeat-containing protein
MSKAFRFTRLFAGAASKRLCARRKLLVETLEGRCVPATFVPDVFTDEFDGNFNSGDLSLREAVHLANITPGADTIQLLPSVYLLSRAGRGENNNVTGDLDVSDPAGLTIRGAFSAVSIVDADGIDRAFEIIGSGALTVIGAMVRNGSETNGGGFSVSSLGSLTLQDCAIAGNLASNRGGGVDNNGTLTIIGSTFASNIAGDFEFSGAGGAINNSSGIVSIHNSEFSSNRAFVEGGAINDRSGQIDVTESIFMNNQADAAAGGGGAISTMDTNLTIADSTFTGNIAAKGGAIQGRGNVTITGSLLNENQAIVPTSTSNFGGALYNTSVMKVVNSTIADNVAGSSTYPFFGYGGAIDNIGSFQLIHATVTGNRASDGGGIRTAASAGVFTVVNSIIAQNTTTAAGNRLDVWGPFNSLGGNFIGYAGGSTGWIASDQAHNNSLGDPRLGPLTFNGGPTFTRAPLTGSPVLDTGVSFIPVPGGITLPDTDQRGLPRPSGPGYDIGAYEFQAPANRAPVAVADSYAVNEDGVLVVPAPGVLGNDSDPDGNSITAVATTSPAHGVLIFNANGSFTYTPHPNYHGPDSFTYKVNDGALDSNVATVTITINAVQDPPVAEAGPDQTVNEAATAAFDGGGSSDADGDALTYTWDFGDGTTATGPAPTHAFADSGVYTVTLTVDDGHGNSHSDTLTVTVQNVAPTTALSGPATGVRGQPRTFRFTASDVSPADQAADFTYTIDWGDGSPVQVIQGSADIHVDHAFAVTGAFTVTVTATDKDSGVSDLASTAITVRAAEMQGNVLVIGGTLANDAIVIRPADGNGNLTVSVNGASLGTFRPTERIIVYAQSGNDTVQLLQSAKIKGKTYAIGVSAVLFGGDGDDVLDARSSSTDNVLVGGAGADVLWGGGDDVLIGGFGADVLHGGRDDDILIGGATAFDDDLAALTALLTEWRRTDLSYQTRIDRLSGAPGTGWMGPVLTAATVHDDAAVDQLYGEGGRDWFIYQASGLLADLLQDRQQDEQATPL